MRFLRAFILLAFSTPALASVQSGVEKWNAGNFAAAVQQWAEPAARGDTEALFNMGQAYRLGRGVTQNRQTAMEFYRRAADKGHVGAAANLGITLWQNGQKHEALLQLRKAAAGGDLRASYVLGVATFTGDGAPRNKPLGYGYVVRAREGGLAVASQQAGRMATLMTAEDRSRGEAVADALASGSPVAVALAGSSYTDTKPAPVTGPDDEDAAEEEVTVATPKGTRSKAEPKPAEKATVKQADVKQADAKQSDGWKVQLGAYGSERAARSAWASLVSQSASLLEGSKPIYSPKGGLVRLQVAFDGRSDASDMCQKLSAAGRPCFITR